MARGIQNFPNITPADSDYPNGRIRDENGSGNGTDINEFSNGDIFQFFAKMIRASGITINGLPDNEYSGNQYFQALLLCAQGYKSYVAIMNQGSTSAPTATVLPNNGIGTIVWSRSGVGTYLGTLTGVFTLNKTFTIAGGYVNNGLAGGFVKIDYSNANAVVLRSYDDTGAASDDIVANTPIEIRVYN